MNSTRETLKSRATTLLGAVACLCFVLQQFLLPIHMLSHEHTFDGFGEVHAHSHERGCASHSETPAGKAVGPEAGRLPHPVEDHADEPVEPGIEPGLVQIQLALLERGSVIERPVLRCSNRITAQDGTPRAPPFVLGARQLRAPPRI